MVVIACFAAAPTGVMHDRWGNPSISTVQAPHWPSPQPYLLPTRSSPSRNTQSKLTLSSTSTEYLVPLLWSSVILDITYLLPVSAAPIVRPLFQHEGARGKI